MKATVKVYFRRQGKLIPFEKSSLRARLRAMLDAQAIYIKMQLDVKIWNEEYD